MIDVSIVILTYNRRESVLTLLGQLAHLGDPAVEVIVVDNGSADGTAEAVAGLHAEATLVALPENAGTGARNRGIERARGEVVVTLDDDMVELSAGGLAHLRERFGGEPTLGAVCFTITWPGTDRVRDWVHRRPVEWADTSFPTYEIPEGAVAWRRAALESVGLYREDFFISHEGLDLALRMLEAGWRIEHDGRVRIGHDHAPGGRKSWRRYYYDTRNLFWIAMLHLPASRAAADLARGVTAMLAYSVRDGHLPAWVRGVRDGVVGMRRLRDERRPLSAETLAFMRSCDRHRPPFLKLAIKRLRQKDFSLE